MPLAERLERTNPVLFRELAAAASHRNFVWFVTAFAAIVALVVVSTWPASMEGYRSASSRQSQQSYYYYVATLTALVILLVPSFALDSVTGERASRTLDLLLASPLSPRDIVAGKAAAAFVLGSLFVALTLPFLAALRLLGGVAPASYLLAYVFLLLLAWSLACQGVLVSSLAPRTWQAAVGTYLGVAFLAYLSALVLDTSEPLGGPDAFATFLRLFVGRGGMPHYGEALLRVLEITLLLAMARAALPQRLISRVLVPLLLLWIVAHDFGGRPFRVLRYAGGPVELCLAAAFLALRELWVAAFALSTMAGLARQWRPVVLLLLALLLADLAGLTPALSESLGSRGAAERLPLMVLFAAFALGLSHLMLELASRQLVPTHLWLAGEERTPFGAEGDGEARAKARRRPRPRLSVPPRLVRRLKEEIRAERAARRRPAGPAGPSPPETA